MDTRPPAWHIAAVVAFYMSAALIMVFVNKAVLNSTPDLPLSFLFIQLSMAVALLHIGALFTSKIDIPRLDLRTARKLAPVVLVNIIGLVFNMLCLRDVEASFFQIARGLVLPFTIAVSSLAVQSRPSTQVLSAAAIVTAGFFVGVVPETSLPTSSIPSLLSLLYGFLSSLFIALHTVLIKTSLPHCSNSTIQLAYWSNAGSAVLLIPIILASRERSKLVSLVSHTEQDITTFIWGCIVTGLFGFLLCIAGLLSIKVTSPVTHMFSSAARSVIQTALAICFFHDILSMNRLISLVLIVSGTMYYTWVKSSQPVSSSQHQSDREGLCDGDKQPVLDADDDKEGA